MNTSNTYFYIGANPTVDLIVIRQDEDTPKVLLIQREDKAVEGGKWAIPGGFQDSNTKQGQAFVENKETPTQAALRELEEETSLVLPANFELTHLGVFEGSGRDPRDNTESWSKSNAFLAILPNTLTPDGVEGRSDAKKAKWFALNALPESMAFDHERILNLGLSLFLGAINLKTVEKIEENKKATLKV